MSTEGKKRLILILFLMILVHSQPSLASSPSMLRGGLVYQEKTTQGPVYINVESITLFRKADPSILVKSAQMARSLGNMYQDICHDVADRVTLFDKQKRDQEVQEEQELGSYVHPYDILFSTIKHQLLDAPQICKEMGGRRPEIRDKNSLEAIRFAAISKGVQKISAGVRYDTSNNIFRFESDDVNVRTNSPFAYLEYGGYYTGKGYHTDIWENEPLIKNYASAYPIIYNHPEQEFRIRLGDDYDKGFQDHILCEVPKPPPVSQVKNENNLLLQVIDHACKRDEKGLLASIKIVAEEIEAITNLNVTLPEDINSMEHFLPTIIQSYNFDDKKRKRRSSNTKRRSQNNKKFSLHMSKRKKRQILKKLNENTKLWDNLQSEIKTTPSTMRRSLITTHKRTKRAPMGPLAILGIGAGATAAANALSSSITGEAPLSWGGRTLGGLFGLKTTGTEDLRALEGVGRAMENLQINQNEIAGTVNMMSRQMVTIVKAIDGTFKATATLVIEQDIKMYVRHLLLVQQNAIQKYAHIMLAASVRQTSPYALSQKELDQTADDLKLKKGIILIRDLSLTRMTASIIDNELYIQIEIPIVNDNNLFNFYNVKPVPVFSGNVTLIPQTDATIIAISKSGSDYVIVTSDELETCINRPWKCTVASPFISMSQNSHCVASTYISHHLTCPLQEKNQPNKPFFHIDGNYTIYSVPQDTRLYIKCSESNLSNKYKDESVTIRGMGEAVFKYSCTVTLPSGAKFTTPAAKTTENTSDLKIFELLKVYPMPTGVVITAAQSILPNSTDTPLSLLQVEVPTKAQLTYEAFHPLRSIPFLIRVACITAFVIVMIIAIKCFWPNIRAWLGRKWYCCCFGPTTEEQEQERREENSRKLQMLTDELNIIKKNARMGAEKWKQSTTSIMSSLNKARSMSNLYMQKEKEASRQGESLLHSTDSLPPPPPPMVPNNRQNTRIVYNAEPSTPGPKRVSFGTNTGE